MPGVFPSPSLYPSSVTYPGSPAIALYGSGVYGADVYGDVDGIPPVPHLVPADRLVIELQLPDGSRYRWSQDEPDAANVFSDLSFSTSIPGGDKSLTCTLTRRIDRDYPDLNLLDKVRVYGPGGQTVWSGEQAEFPRQHDEAFSVSVGAVGRSAVLMRFRNFQCVYIDRDLGSWHEAPLWRRKETADAGLPQGKIPTGTAGGLSWEVPDEALTNNERTELWWEAPAGTLGQAAKFAYKGGRAGSFTNLEAATLYSTDSSAAPSSFASDALTLDDTARQLTLASAKRRLMLRVAASAAVAAGAGRQQRFDRVAVYGDHGLTLHDVANEMPGIYLSDIKEHIISQAAPGLQTEIEQDTTIVPHLAFTEGLTAEEAYLQANKFSFNEWGVYDEVFFDRAPDPDRLCWQARLSDGIGIGLEGPQSEDVYNGVVVSFQDFDGQQRTIGPVGFGCDYESDNLRDWVSTNPYNEWGEVRFGQLDVSQLTNSTGAEIIGVAWLNQASAPKRRGSLVFRGTAQHPTKGARPAWEPRAGDWVRVMDASNDVPRRIVETSYSHETRANTCSVDSTMDAIAPLLELMGVRLVGVF